MKKVFIEFIWKIAGTSSFSARFISGIGMFRRGTYLNDTGWYRSFQKRIPVDADDQPLPWYSYPAIKFLEKRIQPEWHIFEYGCGNSSIWWSKRVARVLSCEHDKEWHERVTKILPDNATCVYKGASSYAEAASEQTEKFDVVIIDGIERVECARHAAKAVKDGGVIIWDNADRLDYAEGYEFLIGLGFKRLGFEGLGPIVMIPTETAIFYRADNCLGL